MFLGQRIIPSCSWPSIDMAFLEYLGCQPLSYKPLARPEFEALQMKYLETHAEKESLQQQIILYDLKVENEDPPTRVRRIWVKGP